MKETVEKDMFGTSLQNDVRAVMRLQFIMRNVQLVLDFRSMMDSVHVLLTSISQYKAIVLQVKDALKLKQVNAFCVILNMLLMKDNVSFALNLSQDVQSVNLILMASLQLVLNVPKENT